MKSPKQNTSEKQIDADATDFAQEVNYAVTHGGRELHPEQKDGQKHSKKHEQPDMPWQVG